MMKNVIKKCAYVWGAIFVSISGYFLLNLPADAGDNVYEFYFLNQRQFLDNFVMGLGGGLIHLFRPLMHLVMWPLVVFSNYSVDLIRWTQFGGTVIVCVSVWVYLRRIGVSFIGQWIGLVCLLGLPALYATFTLPGYIGSFFCLGALFFVLGLFEREMWTRKEACMVWVIVATLPYFMEYGLIVLVLLGNHFFWKKEYIKTFCVIFSLCVYFYLRNQYNGVILYIEPFAFGGGFLTQMYSQEMLMARFGDMPFLYYFYTIFSQFFYTLFSQPTYGQLSLHPFPMLKVFRLTCMVSTTFLIGWAMVKDWKSHSKRWITYVAILGMNAVLSYAHSRARTLPFSGAIYSVMVGYSIMILMEGKFKYAQVISLVLGGLWMGHSLLLPVHLLSEGRKSIYYYLTEKKPIRSDQETYEKLQRTIRYRSDNASVLWKRLYLD